jgi:hypothetical protein
MILRLALVLLAGAALAGEPGVAARLVGGTVPGLAGRHSGHMDLTGKKSLSFEGDGAVLRIPFDRIHTLEYGQHVNRRYAEAILISPLLLLAKSRKHFLTVGFSDEAGQQQAVVFEVGKRDVTAVLAGLEAKTGRRVEYQNEEARKSGKG